MVRIYSDPRCLAHVSPPGFPEIPERVSTVVDGLRSAGFQIQEAGAHRSRETAIQEIHDSRYVSRFEESVRRGEDFLDSGDNPICENTWEAASAAVDAALHAADHVSSVAGNKAMAAIRPPGHHAERGMAMGFCYFNNVAIAADYLIRSAGVERVAIVDFDVHHGNGTQHIFEHRQDVLYVSSHRHPFYPGTGLAAAAVIYPIADTYILGGIHDANGTKTSFGHIEGGEFFTAVELGATPRGGRADENRALMKSVFFGSPGKRDDAMRAGRNPTIFGALMGVRAGTAARFSA